MKYIIQKIDLKKPSTDSVYIYLFEDDIKEKQLSYKPLILVEDLSGNLVSRLIDKKKITGKDKNSTSFYIGKTRYVTVGLGKEKDFTIKKLRDISGIVCKNILDEKDETSSIIIRNTNENFYTKIVEAFKTASYLYSEYFSKEKRTEKTPKLKEIHISGDNTTKTQKEVKKGELIGDARNFVRDLVNHPPNFLNAEKFSGIVKSKLKNCVTVLNKAKIEKLKMGGI